MTHSQDLACSSELPMLAENIVLQALRHVFEGHRIQTVDVEGAVWFVAVDIANALGYSNRWSLRRLIDDDQVAQAMIETEGGKQSMTVVSESALYHLTVVSKKPNAKALRDLVMRVILPEVRRTGSFGQKRPPEAALGEDKPSGRFSEAQAAVLDRVFRTGRYLVVSLPDHTPHVEELDLYGVFKDINDADMDGLVHAVQLIGSLWLNYRRYDTLTGPNATASGIGLQLDHAIRLGRSLAHTLEQRKEA